MIDNPFISINFTSIWLKHFEGGATNLTFDFIDGISFVKHSWLPLYTNVGKNNTKGISYDLKNVLSSDFEKKVFLVYDVPQYFNVTNKVKPKGLSVKKLRQYKGFLIDLNSYENLEGYLRINFGKSTRYKLKKYRTRLEKSFDIHYKMFYGAISPEQHEAIFQSFNSLLVKRFSQKKTVNNNLDKKEWDFFREVSLPMILEKRASLFVIYNDSRPIAVTLSFMGEQTLFDAITVFDTDYSKFNLGYVNIMGLIDWCLENGYNTLDFSKGYFDYKQRWGNRSYDFEYHILYDRKNLKASVIASILSGYFKIKQKLRELKFNELLHKASFFLKEKNNTSIESAAYQTEEIKVLPEIETLEEVQQNSPLFDQIKKPFFSFLYLNLEHNENVKIYFEKDSGFYFLKGTNKIQKCLSSPNQQLP